MYRNLNYLAMQLTKRGGLLMTCSCSGAMTQSGLFFRILQASQISFIQGLVKRYIKHRWNICRYYEKVFCRKNFVFEQLVLKKGFGNCSSLIFAIFFICGRMTVVLFQGRISYFTTGPFWTQYFDAEYIFMCEYPLKF